MADDRTFTLIGNFTDNISGPLKKINAEITTLTRSFSKLQEKLRPISRDLAIMAEASKKSAEGFRDQRTGVESALRAFKEYKKEAGKIVAANQAMQKSLPQVAGSGGGPGGRSMAAAAGGFAAGNQLAGMVTGAIVRGFQLGVSLIEKPFRYAGSAFVERMQDEMSDISSAGSMFAIDKRDKTGVFKSFEDARGFQEELNARLAKSASALPGATSDYVAQAKQLTDDMMLTYSQNKKSFVEFAKTLGPVKDERDALGMVLQKFTEKAVLLGKGSGGSSAYGIPQILSMLLNQDRVNVNAFRQFAAYQSNPLFKNALEKAGPELAKTAKGSAERLKLIQKILDEAVPNEVVQAMKNSMDGVKEAIRSGFLDPETGLFGLGRKLAVTVPKVDALGRYLKKNGEVTSNVNEAARDTASIFSLLRDSLGGFVLPLSELVSILPQIFDPLTNIAEGLVKFRNIAQRFYKNFNQYTADFELLAKNLDDKGFKDSAVKIRNTAGARGALLTFADLLTGIGAFTEGDWTSIAAQLKDPNVNLSTVAKRVFDTLFSSDFMKTVGETIGGLFGSVVSTLGRLMSGASNMAKAGPFAAGLKKGWDAAGGSLGVRKIFQSLFSLIGKALTEAFKAAPLEMTMLSALTVGMPLLTGAITSGVTALFTKAAAVMAGGAAAEGAAGVGAAAAGGSVAAVALPVAAVVGVVLFQDQIIAIAKWAGKTADDMATSRNMAVKGFSTLVRGWSQFWEGVAQLFGGLWDIISGLISGNTQKVKSGVVRVFDGLLKIIAGTYNTVTGLASTAAGTVAEMIKNMFKALVESVMDMERAARHRPTWLGGKGAANYLGETRPNPKTGSPEMWDGEKWTAVAHGSPGKELGSLGSALNYEMRNKPSGSNLVIANSSETIIPAAGGLGMKDLFKTLDERSSATIHAPITIHQQPGQNAEQLAALVAMELGNAIRHSRASSVYV